MPAHDPGLAARGVHLAALRVLHGAELGVHEVDLVPVDAAGPDHAAVAEVHRLLAAEHAGGGQVAVVLVTPVPALIKISSIKLYLNALYACIIIRNVQDVFYVSCVKK